jgi:MFS family permease
VSTDPAVSRAVRLPFFYGWLVVAGVFVLCLPVSGLAFYGLSVYLRALVAERGFTIAAVSGATALSYALGGPIGLVVARWVSRRDPRPMIVVGALGAGAALALVGRATEVWQVYALYGLLGCATSLNSLVVGTTLVTRWFQQRRATALAVAISGLTTGGLLVAPVASWVIERHGLAVAMPWLGLFYVVLAVPFPVAVLRPDPAALGLRPDGAAAPLAGATAYVAPSWDYDRAVRSRAFVTVTATLVFSQLAQVGGIAQLFNAASSRTDEATGRLCLMLVTILGLAGRLAGAPLAARLGSRRFALGCYGAQGLGWAAVAVAQTRPALLAAAVLTGLTVGNTLLLHPLLLSEYFGPASYARIFATSQLVVTGGVAAGPFVLGWVHDHAGGYGAAYGTAALAAALGAVVFATGWRSYRPAELTAPT